MVLKALFVPAANGIEISGAHIFLTVKLPVLGDWPITETQVNSWLVMVTIFFFCRWLTHGLRPEGGTRRQHVAEWIVEQTDGLVQSNMGDYFKDFSPFIGAVLALSAFSSLISLLGLFPPTSDINVTAGWALLVFFLITYYKMKCGPLHYLKSFGEPVAFLAPLNVISEFATPVSMAFRHYGNILSGTVISVLMAAALQGLTQLLLGWLPGFLGEFPFFRIGLPAVLSVYFDLFSGCLQAFIFAMLTMLYVAGGFPEEDYKKKQAKKKIRNA
ncbi:MAG: F0F1 ATP synthase subunit A [Clostridia bacterium]|nr:F0F1 ATP synthase subunit A [Clostridia bacterium]